MPVRLGIGFLGIGLLAQCQQLDPARVLSGGATIEVSFSPGPLEAGRDAALAWISNAANAVSEYFGRFPVQHPRVMVRVSGTQRGVARDDIRRTARSVHSNFGGASDHSEATRRRLDDDHEFIHMAFPDVSGESDEHHWMEEGMATYIEPIARAQIGRMTNERVWGDFARDMPQGLPEAGDQGLDRTRTWGRTYWGGAIFWLLADVEIREATHNQKGLRDAMRGILNAGGNITEDWTVERVAEVGDQATGTTVIADLYKQMKGTAVHTDLDDLWRRLGVQVKNGAATFDDGAPLAEIRKAITAK